MENEKISPKIIRAMPIKIDFIAAFVTAKKSKVFL
jgi:hypothetical protein